MLREEEGGERDASQRPVIRGQRLLIDILYSEFEEVKEFLIKRYLPVSNEHRQIMFNIFFMMSNSCHTYGLLHLHSATHHPPFFLLLLLLALSFTSLSLPLYPHSSPFVIVARRSLYREEWCKSILGGLPSIERQSVISMAH